MKNGRPVKRSDPTYGQAVAVRKALLGIAADLGRAGAPSKDACSPLSVFGNLLRDHALVGERLKVLIYDQASLHGELRVCLSALRRMVVGVERLIAVEEGEGVHAGSYAVVCNPGPGGKGSA